MSIGKSLFPLLNGSETLLTESTRKVWFVKHDTLYRYVPTYLLRQNFHLGFLEYRNIQVG